MAIFTPNLREIDPALRPRAAEALERISCIHKSFEPETKDGSTSDPLFDIEDAIPAEDVPTSSALPIVQLARRYIGSSHQ